MILCIKSIMRQNTGGKDILRVNLCLCAVSSMDYNYKLENTLTLALANVLSCCQCRL
jgi:hypothetical protein